MTVFESKITPKYKLGTVYNKETRLGRDVAFTLLHAVEKQAIVDDIDFEISNLTRAYRILDGSSEGRDHYQSLLFERERAENKLITRSADANNIVLGHPELKVTCLEDPDQVAEGRLMKIDLRQATLELSDDKKKKHTMTFAEAIPVPEGYNQIYFGHKLSVVMEVLSIAEVFEWVLK